MSLWKERQNSTHYSRWFVLPQKWKWCSRSTSDPVEMEVTLFSVGRILQHCDGIALQLTGANKILMASRVTLHSQYCGGNFWHWGILLLWTQGVFHRKPHILCFQLPLFHVLRMMDDGCNRTKSLFIPRVFFREIFWDDEHVWDVLMKHRLLI